MEIGVKLKEARIKSGLTQENVAEKIQVSRQTISNWENEKSFPDIVNVIKLSDLLMILFILFNGLIIENHYLIMGSSILGITATCMLFYQIIKKL